MRSDKIVVHVSRLPGGATPKHDYCRLSFRLVIYKNQYDEENAKFPNKSAIIHTPKMAKIIICCHSNDVSCGRSGGQAEFFPLLERALADKAWIPKPTAAKASSTLL